MKIEEKIQKKIKDFGLDLSIEDLTKEEIESLKEEIKAEERGDVILGGVLENILPYRDQR